MPVLKTSQMFKDEVQGVYQDGEVFVKMTGACAGCDLIDSTLQDGVATLLQEEVPGVVKVTNVVEDVNIDELIEKALEEE